MATIEKAPPGSRMIGRRFGMLLVTGYSHSHQQRSGRTVHYWICKCDCGSEKIASAQNLIGQNVSSCGCLRRQIVGSMRFKHGLTNTPLFRVWNSMVGRCERKSEKNYGGRGIKVCDEWRGSFLVFRSWALKNGYRKGLTIERIDNNGNYEPSNCKWATRKEQGNNKRNNRFVIAFGETKTASQWSEDSRCSVSRTTITKRLGLGWPQELCVSSP